MHETQTKKKRLKNVTYFVLTLLFPVKDMGNKKKSPQEMEMFAREISPRFS